MQQELTGGWPRASQGLDVMAMDPLGQGYDTEALKSGLHAACNIINSQAPYMTSHSNGLKISKNDLNLQSSVQGTT